MILMLRVGFAGRTEPIPRTCSRCDQALRSRASSAGRATTTGGEKDSPCVEVLSDSRHEECSWPAHRRVRRRARAHSGASMREEKRWLDPRVTATTLRPELRPGSSRSSPEAASMKITRSKLRWRVQPVPAPVDAGGRISMLGAEKLSSARTSAACQPLRRRSVEDCRRR